MSQKQHNDSAPVIQFGDQAPAHVTTRPESRVGVHGNTMTPAQRVAWDRLWTRLLQPIEAPVEQERAA